MPENNHDTRLKQELHALTVVAKSLTTHLDLPNLLEMVMDKISQELDPVEFGMIFIWDPTIEHFHPQAVCGPGIQDVDVLYKLRLQGDESITGKVFEDETPIYLGGEEQIAASQSNLQPANRDKMLQGLGSPPHSLVAAPLCVGDRKFGVLFLGSIKQPSVFFQRDVPFIQTVADLIALAIDRARLETEAAEIHYAKHADQLRSEALATLSHELRTPLAAIKGYSTALLLDEISWPEEKQREFLRLIDEECDNLQIMINDILDSALIDVGQMAYEPQPVRLPYLSQEVAEELGRRTEVHRLVVDFPPNFPIVDADPLRIKQVIHNIVDNAVKYSPNGGLVVIRGEVRPKDVVVSIADQGVGISPEDLIPLFEKFFRVKSPTGYHVPGTGLGLPVARAIIEAHGGRIWADSKVDEGTTLYFSIPVSTYTEDEML